MKKIVCVKMKLNTKRIIFLFFSKNKLFLLTFSSFNHLYKTNLHTLNLLKLNVVKFCNLNFLMYLKTLNLKQTQLVVQKLGSKWSKKKRKVVSHEE